MVPTSLFCDYKFKRPNTDIANLMKGPGMDGPALVQIPDEKM